MSNVVKNSTRFRNDIKIKGEGATLAPTMVNASLVSPLAVYFYHLSCQKKGVKSGYEDFISSLDSDMIEIMKFFIDKVKVTDDGKLSEFKESLKEPEKRMDYIDRYCGWADREAIEYFLNDYTNKDARKQFKEGESLENFFKRIGWGSLEASMISSHYFARKRYIQNQVINMIENKGFKQIVLPASGLDSLGERLAVKYPDVQFFISDLAPTIAEKKRLTALPEYVEKFGEPKGNVHYAAVDLNLEGGTDGSVSEISLEYALKKEPVFNAGAKTGYVYEGISMYIDAEHWNKLFDLPKKMADEKGVKDLTNILFLNIHIDSVGENHLVGAEAYQDFFKSPLDMVKFFKNKNMNLVAAESARQIQGDIDIDVVGRNFLARSPEIAAKMTVEQWKENRNLYGATHCNPYSFSSFEKTDAKALENVRKMTFRAYSLIQRVEKRFMTQKDKDEFANNLAQAFITTLGRKGRTD